ncbi:organic hydroperoxide resistance protein [Carboxylicivirga linearis]|uniref:Organic hydroperoxide resistance protein n=1 Tax=Carboxylicivirga linearis TaxID=1628157 RepID=A0ABS5JWD6_9BACT|nr:organic hydroperoxide resistance protein [Carboxylicivirga linearis]MBS2098791.1 organic hydroperoxide resistance protein [Carboxylicivirga linearis]
MKTIYQTTAEVSGGRNGKVKSNDGILDLEVRLPKAMGGANDDFTNPEQLFAAGYAACFDNALIYVAHQQKIRIKSKLEVTVALQMSETEGYNLCVQIEADIQGTDAETAQKLLEQAHATCPYSKAIKGNVVVELKLK